MIDGVEVIRRGSEATTRFFAPGARAARSRPDVVLEEINTLPYLAPLWSRAPVVLYMNQLARDVWWYEAPLPVAAVGLARRAGLPAGVPRLRRDHDLAVVARRPASARVRARAVWVAPMAPDADAPARPCRQSAAKGNLLAIGRLTPSKRYDHAIAALADLRRTHPSRVPDADR